jgi:hypothetical protein
MKVRKQGQLLQADFLRSCMGRCRQPQPQKRLRMAIPCENSIDNCRFGCFRGAPEEIT